MTTRSAALADLFDGAAPGEGADRLAEGATILHGFARGDAAALIAAVSDIAADAPFRNMMTPAGFRMSVAMSNCGRAGWVTDKTGYRYEPADPTTGRPWPAMPALFQKLASGAAEQAAIINFFHGCRCIATRTSATMTRRSCRFRSGCPRPFCSAASAAATGRGAFGWRVAMSSSGAARRGWPTTAWHPWPMARIR